MEAQATCLQTNNYKEAQSTRASKLTKLQLY